MKLRNPFPSLSALLLRAGAMLGLSEFARGQSTPNTAPEAPQGAASGRDRLPTRGSLSGVARFRVSKPFGHPLRRRAMRVNTGRTSTVGRLRTILGASVGTPIGGEINREALATRKRMGGGRIPFGAMAAALA